MSAESLIVNKKCTDLPLLPVTTSRFNTDIPEKEVQVKVWVQLILLLG